MTLEPKHPRGEDRRTEPPQVVSAYTKKRRLYMKFDPTVSTGVLLQIAVVLGSVLLIYTSVVKDQTLQKAELDTVKIAVIQDRTSVKESLTELKTDIKDLQKSTNEIKESLAVLRGRASEVRR